VKLWKNECPQIQFHPLRNCAYNKMHKHNLPSFKKKRFSHHFARAGIPTASHTVVQPIEPQKRPIMDWEPRPGNTTLIQKDGVETELLGTKRKISWRCSVWAYFNTGDGNYFLKLLKERMTKSNQTPKPPNRNIGFTAKRTGEKKKWLSMLCSCRESNPGPTVSPAVSLPIEPHELSIMTVNRGK